MNPATALLAHSDIAPARKQDPGEFFPWQELAQEGLGVWGATPFPDNALVRAEDITSLLQSIGYDTTDLSAALLAFQRRYVPKILTGLADNETLARLCAISLLRAAATP